MRPIATDDASVCLCVCWWLPWALHKRLNRSRYSLGYGLTKPKKPCIIIAARISARQKALLAGTYWHARDLFHFIRTRQHVVMRLLANVNAAIYWRCLHSMRSRVYVTAGCPSVCPVDRQKQRRAAGLLLSEGACSRYWYSWYATLQSVSH